MEHEYHSLWRVYIFPFVDNGNNGELQSIKVNGVEYIDDKDFKKRGCIIYLVQGYVNIEASFTNNLNPNPLWVLNQIVEGNCLMPYPAGVDKYDLPVSKVLGISGNIVIDSAAEAKAGILKPEGILVSSSRLSPGKNVIPMPSGIYIVNINGKSYKIAVR